MPVESTKHVAGIDIQTAGYIVMIVGIVGLAISLLLTLRARWGDPYAS